MHGNMVFSRESIFPTPQQSGCLCVCIVHPRKMIEMVRRVSHDHIIIRDNLYQVST